MKIVESTNLTKYKQEINDLERVFNKLLENIKENAKVYNNNNDTNQIVSKISKNMKYKNLKDEKIEQKIKKITEEIPHRQNLFTKTNEQKQNTKDDSEHEKPKGQSNSRTKGNDINLRDKEVIKICFSEDDYT
ncbi:uncharacterized protein MKS88_000309 [Plasmodium brasilianum]|uniref:uncharacterized protein n=1 Tax=Plasmodium brasilianum TaxID=5824 RepID=UPI00350E446B|nr:hypothetical protein MKS88_000309 [Plasmodium brasilianum]